MDGVLHQANLTSVLLKGRKQQFTKGQVLHFSEERMTVSIIETGYVKRYSITNEGVQSIQSVYGPTDIFPLTPVFKLLFNKVLYTGPEVLYYEAITPVTLYSISASELSQALEESPDLYRDLLYVCGVRLKSNIQRLENISLKTAQSQVAHQLLYCAEKFGTTEGDLTRIDIPLTHQTLANILNLARETVTVNLQRLQEKQLIRTTPDLAITDMEGLRKEAFQQ